MIGTRILGHSGIEIGELALGTMMFGRWGNTDVGACHRMVHRAIDAGVTMFDTADIYDDGASEEILGAALAGRRDEVVVATKVGNPMGGDPARSGLSPRWIRQACDDSLRRLRIAHVDLYQLHRPDPATPIEATLEALDGLVAAGKVRAIGTSTFSAAQLDELHSVAGDRGWVRPTSEQPPYSMLARAIEAAVLPLLAAHDVGAVVWAPLNGGWLTGKYQRTEPPAAESRAAREPEHFDHRDDLVRADKQQRVASLTEIAADVGMSLPQLALAFILDTPTVTAAIIGPRTPEQLDQLLGLGSLALPAGVRERIDAVVAPGTNVNPADAG
jgi:aryl-alcohol dehydrogenase (NADP+)